MIKPKPHKKLYMHRSILTGKVIWLCYATSPGAKRLCYYRAVKYDAKLSKLWPKMEERRMQVVHHILDECLADIPVTKQLTPVQRNAAKRLQVIAEESIPFYRVFGDHVREERRRLARFRQMMSERRERERNAAKSGK